MVNYQLKNDSSGMREFKERKLDRTTKKNRRKERFDGDEKKLEP